MNLIASKHAKKIESILEWFSGAIESLEQFGEYDQLQLILCAHELNVRHENIFQKVGEIAKREESNSMDYVFEYLEQLVLMKYQKGESRQQRYFDYWIREENCMSQTDVTIAYNMGYLLMDENKLSSPELRRRAVKWLKDTEFLSSMSFTAWTVYYLDKFDETEAAKIRLDELLSLRLENGSWNNIPLHTLQIAYPLSLSSFGSDESLEITREFILSQPWESYSGDITYETGLLKWLKVNGFLN